MNLYRFSFYCATLAAIVAAGLVTNTGSVYAQQATEEQAGEVIEEIVEVAAPVVRRQYGRPNAIGMRVETIKLSQRVSYADLDLSKHADVIEFKVRIEATAKESCEQLSDMVPFDQSDRREIRRCTNRAVDNVEDEVQEAIAAAS